ncbi:MAG: hypothetical protein IJ189_00210 [Clostridia bacterium]|nr:hypothetical protein [Clostridia bacterium]
MRNFLRLFTLMLCVLVLTLGYAHVSFADGMTDMEAFFSKPEGSSGLIDVPGKGSMRYYAQNDSLWGSITYEREDTNTRRPFRDSGCSPTALAMAVASLVPEEKLSLISVQARREYSLCSCSVNKARCNHSHTRYVLTSQRDYVRFLPLVFGDYATGNNASGNSSRGIAAGTGTGYIKDLIKIYGLTMEFANDYASARKAIRAGKAVVGLAGRGGAFTNQGHYIFLANADDEQVYILDPLCRTTYAGYNQGNKVNLIQPGLVSLKHEDIGAAKFSNFIIIDYAAP